MSLDGKKISFDRNLGFENPGCYCWSYSWLDSKASGCTTVLVKLTDSYPADS